MSLILTTTASGTTSISSDGSYSNAALFETDQNGGQIPKRYFAKSSLGAGERITNCYIRAVDSTVPDQSSWFTFALDNNGSAGSYGSSLLFDIPLGGSVGFWVKSTIPANQTAGNKTDISISISYTAATV